MLSEELKDRIKRHVTNDFETSTTDSEEVSDGIVDSISAGLDVFQPELYLMSDEDETEFYEYVDTLIQDLVEEFEEQLEELKNEEDE